MAQKKTLPLTKQQLEALKPKYYTETKHQAIDIIEDWGLDFLLGNVLKYLNRAGKKNPNTYTEDLIKAWTYLGLKIERLQLKEQQDERTPNREGHVTDTGRPRRRPKGPKLPKHP